MIDIVKPRIPTKYIFTDENEMKNYDLFMRKLRDKGWINPKSVINAGISKGVVIQLGHGPGYCGAEWLKNTSNTKLKALEVNAKLIEISKRNIQEYKGLEKRIEYVNCSAEKMDIDDESIDGVFAYGAVNSWPNPLNVFNEINRVLKTGGKYFILAHRRDMNFFVVLFEKYFLFRNSTKEEYDGYKESVNAAYTYKELKEILEKSELKNWNLTKYLRNMTIIGEK